MGYRVGVMGWIEAILLPIAAGAANLALESAFPSIKSPLFPFLALAYVALRLPNALAWTCLGVTVAVALGHDALPRPGSAPWADTLADAASLVIAGVLFIAIRSRLDRQATRTSLRNSEEAARFRRLLSSSPDGIWRIDAANVTLEVNEPMANMLGYR